MAEVDSYAAATVAAAGLALGTHAGLQFYELKPMDWVCLGVASNASLFIMLGSDISQAHQTACVVATLDAIYFGVLFASIFIYRVFFHRIRHFPGPFWASTSKLWATYIVSTGNYHRQMRRLHEKYGDFVRIGPRELDVCNVEAVPAIFGSGSKCRKGPWYDGAMMGSHERFLQIALPAEHQWKRRIWDAGFSSKALREYEPIVMRHIDELVRELGKYKETDPVDLGLYFSFFTFDVMGDLGFGESFHMIQSGRAHDYMRYVQGFAHFNALISTIPWCSPAFAWLPKPAGAEGLFRLSARQVKERLPLGTSRKDVFSHLLRPDKVTSRTYTDTEIILESLNLIIGGSDTTSSTLASIWYFLVANPGKYKKLQAEIDAHDGPLDHIHLAKFPYLNAVVRETLRLLPPVASGMMHRVTPPEGITVGTTYIPGNVMVGIGAYHLQRDARYFGKPDDFIPERWLGEGPEPFDRNAFIPFSVGPYACVGKHLAYQELCDVTAAMCKAFDITFADDYDPSGYESSIKDTVISSRVQLPVRLKKRNPEAKVQGVF